MQQIISEIYIELNHGLQSYVKNMAGGNMF